MKLILTNPAISLRAMDQTDMASLLEIYGSTREQEMKRVPDWSDEMKREFIASQFQAQHEYYQKNYPQGDFWIIESDKKKIGRLYVHENFRNQGVRIIDITLLPAYRNRGIGNGILKDLMDKSAALNRPLSIHVESFNPAQNLYTRLGFKKISETNGVYHLMEWNNTI